MARGARVIPVATRLARRRLVDDNGCWIWQGRHNNCGYGSMTMQTPDGPRSQSVHRVAYEHFVGPIPAGMYIDHLCRVRDCFNPDHLEPVTPRENLMRSPIAPAARNARKTHCPRGHAYTPDNIYASRETGRICRTCQNARSRGEAVSA